MKKTLQKFILTPLTFVYVFLLLNILTITKVLAEGTGAGVGAEGTGGGTGGEGTGAGTRPVTTVTLANPLNNITSIEGLLVAILNIFIVLMIPVIVFFIILSGFKYVMAQGNASKIEEATRSLTYAIIGGVLILGAVAIAEIIKNTVQAF
ncbi:MAG: Type secretion system pilin [Candidatus Parcubacteria bacterium]|jgi:hypothetical protein